MTQALLVITDLDGTLLDHHSYSFAPAHAALAMLARLQVPLIINSSKTRTEIAELRRQLRNTSPYIVENGAGIYLPTEGGGEDTLVRFGMDRAEVLAVLQRLRKKHAFLFTGFSDMVADELAALTGLELQQAEQAMTRDFSEPLRWEDSEERYVAFCGILREQGLEAVKGGRFVHVAAPADKGQALRWLREHYAPEEGGAPVRIIALGDGENDVSMLEAADYPVIIRSPVNPLPAVSHPQVLVSDECGPEGWNLAVLTLLDELVDPD